MPILSKWLSECLLCPLLHKDTVKLEKFVWFKEEEKDELFDVNGQFKVAALILADMKKGKLNDATIEQVWTTAHGASFTHLHTVLDSDSEMKQ